jgi:hypothetical protein
VPSVPGRDPGVVPTPLAEPTRRHGMIRPVTDEPQDADLPRRAGRVRSLLPTGADLVGPA